MNFGEIDDRLRAMEQTIRSRKYTRKCSSFEETLLQFFASCPHSPTLTNALPDDICFLVWKDSFGKTTFQSIDCPFIGEHGTPNCNCPLRLSAGTAEGMMQQLKKMFKGVGRIGQWNNCAKQGNPVMSPSLKFVKEEQAHVSTIASYINRQLQRTDLMILERFIMVRDQALLKLVFCR